MGEEHVEEVMQLLEELKSRQGMYVSIKDRISTIEGSFDRHFTTLSIRKFRLANFGIRFSGGIAFLEGEEQYVEFRSDAIRSIAREGDKMEILAHIKGSVFRKIELEFFP